MVGDIWAFSLSSLELNNAETKRVAASGGSRRQVLAGEGLKRCPLLKHELEGPAQLVTTRGYSTTMVISTMKNMAAASYLRRGGGVVETPDSRVKQRLVEGTGRMTLGSSSSKLSLSRSDYDPRTDTCVAALARKIREISSV
jgi:hypothetical protein